MSVLVERTMTGWGGARQGAGRKKKTTPNVKCKRLRISEGLYLRWIELKDHRKAKSDEEVLSYLLDLAREVDHGHINTG